MAAPEGSYRPAARDLEVELRGVAADPVSVLVAGQSASRVSGETWPTGTSGWMRTPEGSLVIRTRDRFEPFTITVSR
jgi:hypothetical protein